MQAISRQQARELIETRTDLTVVEVLDEESFREFHLPGARNVPLDESFTVNIRQAVPDLNAPVLLYCMDAECQASSTAGKKMEDLGYTEIYDYEAGKIDWKESGQPIEEDSRRSA